MPYIEITDEQLQALRDAVAELDPDQPEWSLCDSALAGVETALGHPVNVIADRAAVNRIHGLMSGKEWSADTLDDIAGVLVSTGREIESVDEVPVAGVRP